MNKNNEIYSIGRNEKEDISIDRSLVEIRNEEISITILNIIGDCFINNLVFIVSNLISTINLILIGHILLQDKTHYELFMTYEIGVSIINFFGKITIIGLLRYIFEIKEYRKIYFSYLGLKSGLILVIPFIMIPVSFSSYFIIKLLLQNNLDIYNQSLNKEVYFKFMIFTPIIYFFEILFYLNLKLLRAFEETKSIISYSIFFIISHIVSCWILLFILKIGILGLTISYCFNSFLFYLFTNSRLNNIKEEELENFFILPPKEYFDVSVINTFKEASSLSMNKGFYLTIRDYLLHSKESNEEKKKYIIVFSITFLSFIISLFAILIIFRNILLNIYLINGGDRILRIICRSIQIVYSLCILFNGIQILLYGFNRGMASSSPIFSKFIKSFICFLLCLILCFPYKKGILGLWIALLILCVFHFFENGYKSIIHFNNFFFI